MSTVRTNTILDSSGGNTAQINGMTPTAQSLQGFRNRIINGDMRIDQRNAGASVNVPAATFVFPVDRTAVYRDTASAVVSTQRNAVSLPSFPNAILVTVSTGAAAGAGDQNIIQQSIEGFNVADLGWGTASAQTITLSFWAWSSVVGTYGVGLSNSAANRVYVGTYNINAANTWEYKTITVPGDTTGAWLNDNGIGIRLRFDLGSGSNFQGAAGSWGTTLRNTVAGRANFIGTSGASFYLTGVQLEAGSVATPFERRDYGRELIMCQRYYEKSYSHTTIPGSATTEGMVLMPSVDQATSQFAGVTPTFRAEKRAAPTISIWDVVGNAGRTTLYSTGGLVQQNNNNNISGTVSVTSSFYIIVAIAAGNFVAFQWAASSEL